MNTLPTNIVDGENGHAGFHNATNAQVNQNTTDIANRVVRHNIFPDSVQHPTDATKWTNGANTAVPTVGPYGVSITPTAGSFSSIFTTPTNGFPVLPSTTYVVRAVYFGPTHTRTVYLSVVYYDVNDEFISSSPVGGTTTSPTSLPPGTIEFFDYTPENAAYAVMNPQEASAGVGETIWVNNITMEPYLTASV